MKEKNHECIIFGQAIRKLRQSKGFSQESFAAQANLHRTYLGGIERGERNPTLVSIFNIARALDVSLQELFKKVDLLACSKNNDGEI